MADINTTILIKAQDEASNTIKKVAETTKTVGVTAKGAVGGVNALGTAIKSSLGPLLSIAVAVEGLRKSLQLASDAQEATSKAMQVFRNNTAGLKQAVDELSKSYGMSTLEATTAMGALGDLFKPLGFAEQDALKLSQTTVKLARDLASFNNLKTEDVLRDVQSALVGNTESVRKYGVVLNETTIAQAAVNAGLNPKNLTPAQKSWLILQEIIKSNADALGDYQRTQDSFANTMRRLQTVAIEIGAAFGGVVMDAIQPFSSGLADIAERAMPYILKAFQALGGILQFIAGLVKTLLQVFDLLATFLVRSFGDIVLKAIQPLLTLVSRLLNTIAKAYNQLADVAKKIGVDMPKIAFDFENATNILVENLDNVIMKTKEGKTLFEALGLTAKKTAQDIAVSLPSVDVSAPAGAVTGTGVAQKSKTSEATAATAVVAQNPLAGALVMFAEKFQQALSQASVVFNYLSDIIGTFARVIANRIAPVIDAVFLPFVQLLDQFFIIIGEQIGNLFVALQPLLQVLVSNVIQTLAIFVLQIANLLNFVVPVLQFLAQLLVPFMRVVSFILNLIYKVIAVIYNNVFLPIVNVFIKAFNAIGGFFAGALNFVIDIINGVIGAINNVLRWLRWQEIGGISRINWSTISEAQAITVPSSATGAGATASGGVVTSGGGLSVQTERPIYVNFTNNGVLAGFKDEDEFIAWLRTGLNLASARG